MSEGLTKFGVFTGVNEVSRTFKHPRQKYRFRVDLIGFGDGNSEDITLETVSVTRPKVNFEVAEIHGMNSRSYIAGKPEFETISLVVRDSFDNAVEKAVTRQLNKQFDFFEQFSATVGQNYKFEMKIHTLSGHGDITETWHGYGCWLINTDFGDFNYSSSDSNEISMTIRGDNWILFDETNSNQSTGGNFSTFLDRVSAF